MVKRRTPAPKSDQPKPAAAPVDLAAFAGTIPAPSVAALPNYDPRTVAFGSTLGTAHEKPPAIPHSPRLLIVRAQGGYILFAAQNDCDGADADPCDAVGVASTADDLIRRIRDWTAAQPTPEFSA